jgi:hypothetical protein
MSELGQSRHFSRRPAASGLPQTTDIVRPPRHVGWCHFRTHAWQQTVPLLDHFVGALCSLHIERRVKPKRISETCPRRAGSTRTQLRKPLAKVRPLFGKPDRSLTSPIGYQVVRGAAVTSSTCAPNFALHPQSGRGRAPSRSARTRPAGDSSNRTAAPRRHSARAS